MTISVIQTIELDVEGFLSNAWKNVEGVIEADALALWNDGKALLTKIEPKLYTQLKALVLQVGKDVASGDIAGIETAILNAAEGAGLQTVVAGLGSKLLQAFIGMILAAIP